MKWIWKTSSIRVASSREDQVYRSLEDAPAELRERIRETLEGPNAETIFIANAEAYNQIVEKSRELKESGGVGPAPQPQRPTRPWGLIAAVALAALAVVALIGLWIIQIGRL